VRLMRIAPQASMSQWSLSQWSFQPSARQFYFFILTACLMAIRESSMTSSLSSWVSSRSNSNSSDGAAQDRAEAPSCGHREESLVSAISGPLANRSRQNSVQSERFVGRKCVSYHISQPGRLRVNKTAYRSVLPFYHMCCCFAPVWDFLCVAGPLVVLTRVRRLFAWSRPSKVNWELRHSDKEFARA
jgi:hypothetical protein